MLLWTQYRLLYVACKNSACNCQNVGTVVKELLKKESSDVYEEDKKHLTPRQ